MAAPEKVECPVLYDAPCNKCISENNCKKGRACWDYIDFVKYGTTNRVDRRPSKMIFIKLVADYQRTVTHGLRKSIDDYEAA